MSLTYKINSSAASSWRIGRDARNPRTGVVSHTVNTEGADGYLRENGCTSDAIGNGHAAAVGLVSMDSGQACPVGEEGERTAGDCTCWYGPSTLYVDPACPYDGW
jgi:hypothetical protein